MEFKLWEPVTIRIGSVTEPETWLTVGSGAGGVFVGQVLSTFLKQLAGKPAGLAGFALGTVGKILTAFIGSRVFDAIKAPSNYKGAFVFGSLLSIATEIVDMIAPGAGAQLGFTMAETLKSWAMGARSLVTGGTKKAVEIGKPVAVSPATPQRLEYIPETGEILASYS